MLGSDSNSKKGRLQGDHEEEGALKEVNLPIGKYRCPKFLLGSTFWVLMAIIAVFVVLLVVPIMEAPEQQNCLALVIFVSLLWATEVWTRRIIVRLLTTNTHPGYSSVRYVLACTIPLRDPASCT
jgi:phosphate transporter